MEDGSLCVRRICCGVIDLELSQKLRQSKCYGLLDLFSKKTLQKTIVGPDIRRRETVTLL